jgi:aminoglycoside phosphotransferase (APT) family kinase protein
MFVLTPENAVEYLHFAGYWPAHIPARAKALTGGVSNLVVRVQPADESIAEPRMIVKQSADLLRTKMEWRSRRERIWIETEAMKYLTDVLPAGTVPVILFEDRENFLFGMSDLGEECEVWKQLLLKGHPDTRLAQRAGEILALIHRTSAAQADLFEKSIFADTTVFDELRIDPYYRTIAKAHPQITPVINQLIDTMSSVRRKTLVLADFSPKNMLVDRSGELRLVDFETAHWGDPAFDLGFFMTHLVLKSFRAFRLNLPGRELYPGLVRAFWSAYQAGFGTDDPVDNLEERAMAHLSACMLARVDGKSPVDYLSEPDQNEVRLLTIAALETSREQSLDGFLNHITGYFHREPD